MKNPILKDAAVFDESFIPDQVLFREGHVQEILNCLSPIKQGISAKNLYISGPSGTGKTTVLKHLLNKHFKDNHVYINVWNNRTSHKILEEILRQMNQGIYGNESTSELIRRFGNLKKNVIICLDEADQLKDAGILYVFARNSCPLVLVSNQPYSPWRIDTRIRSSLHMQEIPFDVYKPKQVSAIINERASSGLHPQSIEEKLLEEISACSGGDARSGIQMLKNAAMSSESKELEAITADEIRIAATYSRKYRISYLLGKLNEHQKIIYEVLKENKSMDSGALFNEYRKIMKETVTSRSYRNYMQRMVELGLVRESGSGRWKRYEIVI